MSQQAPASQSNGIKDAKVLLWAGVVVHAAIVLSVQSGYLNPLFDDSTHRKGKGADFFAVYQAAQNIRDNISVYEIKPENQVVPYFYPYRYHPIIALTVGQIFRLLPAHAAYGIWIIIQEFLFFINIVLTRRLLAEERHKNTATALWCLFSPYFLELYMGQFSFLMSSLFFWMLVGAMKSKMLAVDAFWTGSLIVKSNSALFLPVFLKMNRWKTVVGSGIFVSVLGLPYFLLVPGSLASFSLNILEPLTMPTLAGNQGLAALIGILKLRLGDLWPDSVYGFLGRVEAMNHALEFPSLMLAILVVSFSVFITFKASDRHVPELFLLWVLAFFLFYKHVWEHHYVMTIPVFVFLYFRMKTNSILLSAKVFWTTFLIIAFPTAFVFIDKTAALGDPELYWSHFESFLFHAPKPLAALTLYIALSVALWKGRLT